VRSTGDLSDDVALAKYKQNLAEENQRLHELNASLRKQRDDLLEKLRQGEMLDGN
jgi:1,2-phenylacetyl-CoA epoxidase catalytic subunit